MKILLVLKGSFSGTQKRSSKKWSGQFPNLWLFSCKPFADILPVYNESGG